MSYEIDSDVINVERDGGIATVEVDKPETKNSLDVPTLESLAAAVNREMEHDGTNVVVLGGTGDAFMSGADIQTFHKNEGTWWIREFRHAFSAVEDAIEDGRKPVIAAVDGFALGGGTEIALMCDLIYASERTQMGLPEIGIGGIPGAGGTQRLAHVIGPLKAKEMIMTGEHVSGSEAADIGLANDVIADADFDDHVAEIATKLAKRGPMALWFAKDAINQTREGLEKGLAFEAALASNLFQTTDFVEGAEAFMEKREPEFSDWSDLS